MTEDEAVAKLDAIGTDSKEDAHIDADRILIAFVPPIVREAYINVIERAGGFWYA